MKLIENISTLSAALVGSVIFILSLYSFYIDYYTNKPMLNLAIDIALLFLSAVIVGGSLNIRKKLVTYRISAEKTFNEVIYTRLKPIMEEVALGIVEVNSMRKKLEEVERKISAIEELATTQKLTPEQKINFYFKAMIVMLFYLGTFVYLMQYTLPYNYLISILLFIYWWLFITYEYNIFHRGESLIMLAAPVLIAPSAYILLRILLGVAAAQGLIFAFSALYAYYYYTIAKKIAGEKAGNNERFLKKVKDIKREHP